MSMPTGAVIVTDSLVSDFTEVGDIDETIKIQGHLDIGGKIEIGTSSQLPHPSVHQPTPE